ncbi:MAG TPA: hypothetical protein VIJ52_00770 [Pseudolabrys sp.]
MRDHVALIAEAERIAALTCQQIDRVLAQVEALDRAGRQVTLLDWLTGEIEHRDKVAARSDA